jgi:hypothetical protein
MTKRQNRPLSVVGESKPISDKSRLLWERYFAPMQGAAQALNSAIVNTQNVIGGMILELEGVTPETHVFDADNMKIIPRPRKE